VKGSLYILLFAAVLGTLCATVLTGVGQLTKPYREANRQADQKRHILRVLEVPLEPGVSSTQLLEIYNQNVRQESRGQLELYSYSDSTAASGGVRAWAVHFEGSGLWGPIKGYLALEADLRTIRGLTFYEQMETPGLGGRIDEAQFRDQFKGLSIVSAEGRPGLRITSQASALIDNQVDAISAATMTCQRVEQILNATIERIIAEGGPR